MAVTPISPGLVGRITEAARYVISGVKPGAWFGPLQPLQPMAPADVAGRRFDYPTGYNLTSLPRSYEPVSFEDLRALADNCDILRSVIETRKDQVEAQEWTVRVAASDFSARIPVASDDQKRRIEAIMTFFHSPDREHGFHQWLRQILEDMFVIDAVAVYKRRNRAGGLFALEVMDAATIKLLLDDSGRAPTPPDPAYQQVLKGVPAADYTREELMYVVHNPRSHKVYGYSHVEQVLITINILIRRALHQLEYYRDGSTPDALIGAPKEWTADQIASFQKSFDAMLAGNSPERRRARFLPGDFKYQEIKAPPLKDQYDEFLARVICFVFSISPEPFVGQVNRATAETSQARAVDEGLAPLMRFVRSLMNRIIAREFASPDLEFAWTETRAQDPGQAAQIDVAYVGAGILTVDEVRANMGLPPIAQAENPTPAPSPVKKKLRKDGDGDDSDDEDDGGDDSGDDSADDADGSDFDTSHPRWPAGSPGGIGGEFAPKDSGDATAALHEAISQDAEDHSSATQPAPLDPGKVSDALTSAIDQPSDLTEGTQVAEDDTVQGDAVPESWGNPDTLARHFEDHGADFNAESPEDYASQADEFFQQAQENGFQIKLDSDGYTSIYDPQTNTFGSYNPDGTARTYFKPDTGAAYFDEQPGELQIRSGSAGAPSEGVSSPVLPGSTDEGGSIGSGGAGGGGSFSPDEFLHHDPFMEEEGKPSG